MHNRNVTTTDHCMVYISCKEPINNFKLYSIHLENATVQKLNQC